MCWEKHLTNAFNNSVPTLQQHPLSTACNPTRPEDKFVVPPDELHDVCTGRPSKWGNEWKIGIHGTRDEVVDKYEEKVLSSEDLICEIRNELPNLSLACPNKDCLGKRCHTKILARVANHKGTIPLLQPMNAQKVGGGAKFGLPRKPRTNVRSPVATIGRSLAWSAPPGLDRDSTSGQR